MADFQRLNSVADITRIHAADRPNAIALGKKPGACDSEGIKRAGYPAKCGRFHHLAKTR